MQRILGWILGVIIFAGCTWFIYWAATAPATGSNTPHDPIPAVTANDWMRGTLADGKVQIVEYSDFECPSCAAYKSILEDVYKKYSDKVVVVYRHFPIPKHTLAPTAAQAAEAAGAQGKFWEMHDLLFENQDTWNTQTKTEAIETFKGYAEKIGLDLTKFNTDLTSEETIKKVMESFVGGSKAGVQWTPSIFINGTLLQDNPKTAEDFLSIITNAAN